MDMDKIEIWFICQVGFRPFTRTTLKWRKINIFRLQSINSNVVSLCNRIGVFISEMNENTHTHTQKIKISTEFDFSACACSASGSNTEHILGSIKFEIVFSSAWKNCGTQFRHISFGAKGVNVERRLKIVDKTCFVVLLLMWTRTRVDTRHIAHITIFFCDANKCLTKVGTANVPTLNVLMCSGRCVTRSIQMNFLVFAEHHFTVFFNFQFSADANECA